MENYENPRKLWEKQENQKKKKTWQTKETTKNKEMERAVDTFVRIF